ncbi:MAG: hypothetical protein IPO52_10235 [Gemmatimonadetes bacterium]|nr:hypothetical protein [Gemmatimonadota bacterium]
MQPTASGIDDPEHRRITRRRAEHDDSLPADCERPILVVSKIRFCERERSTLQLWHPGELRGRCDAIRRLLWGRFSRATA